ncbi:hypothetical protein AVEN_131250-1 [Araneus ventricosus]|uniref:Uncharacterized protein n=1 Tax=Araneus ventricosus TaxID=182803 RepID=A0A4Y2LR55_ARAVE|nr:hypothetical protein AVEN_131250-1 [Araneus ventricosus]
MINSDFNIIRGAHRCSLAEKVLLCGWSVSNTVGSLGFTGEEPFLAKLRQTYGLEEGGGLITAGESSKSSDMLYSKASSSDAEEEFISASASDSQDCKIHFYNGGRTAIDRSSMSTGVGEFFFNFFLFETDLKSGRSGEDKASSLTGATDGEEEISEFVIGVDALVVESEGLEIDTVEISLFLSAEGAKIDFFPTET